MTGTGRRVRRGACALLMGGALAGCEELKPHRTEWDASKSYPPPVTCDIVSGIGQVAEHCRNRIWEHSKEYDLLFTEFTDQGLVYPDQKNEGRGAGYQINHTIDALRTIIDPSTGTQGISLIVFVHGWHHNASSEDGNVESFRRLLRSAADIESARNTGYRVVGVYVGWRGETIRPFPLNYTTFWGRKAAATRVAQGSPRELFNRLRNFRCSQNKPKGGADGGAAGSGDCPLPADVARQRPKVSTVLVGHSFGAWILYNALAGSLAESLQQVKDREAGESGGGVNLRYADMVVLLNPAFEASRYTPLHRISTAQPWLSRYQPPMLVSVTSSGDQATGSAFPIGRFVNSIMEDPANEEERYATKYTMGHMTGSRANYITHELTLRNDGDDQCKGWRHLGRVSRAPSERFQVQRDNIEAEVEKSEEFFQRNKPSLPHGWERPFCGGVRLTHKQNDPHSVVWNVRADRTIMADHNDISNPNLIDFMRQMYQEIVLHTWWTGPNTASPARSVAK